jgi:hypothetical protein
MHEAQHAYRGCELLIEWGLLHVMPQLLQHYELWSPWLAVQPGHPESPFRADQMDEDIQQVIDAFESVRDAAI